MTEKKRKSITYRKQKTGQHKDHRKPGMIPGAPDE